MKLFIILTILLLPVTSFSATSLSILCGIANDGPTDLLDGVPTVFGAGVLNTGSVPVWVDQIYSAPGSAGNFSWSFPTDTITTQYQINTLTPENKAPYTLVVYPYSGWTILEDQILYQYLTSNGVMVTRSYSTTTYTNNPIGTPPPITETTVATCQTAPSMIGSSQCGNDSSTGWGIEFLQAYTGNSGSQGEGFLGSSSSGASNSFGVYLAAIKYNHPTWTWQDIKGAFRQTSANWSTTGYNASTGGYGIYNYASASAITSTFNIYLQPPNMAVTINTSNEVATFTIYPYLQTRRDHEVVYRYTTPPSFSSVNEFTSIPSGGTLVYDDRNFNGYATPGVTPKFTVYFSQAGTFYFVPFTIDSLGNASRVESFSATQVVTMPNMCK